VGARHKLNNHHILGAITVAGIVGLLTGSWLLAAVVGAVAIGLSINAGDIRFTGRR
jgi:hypothetical protein